jgi:hypothetical protein
MKVGDHIDSCYLFLRYTDVERQEARQTEARIVIPFARDEDFVGREDILEKLSNMFSEPKYLHRVALQGLGGVG